MDLNTQHRGTSDASSNEVAARHLRVDTRTPSAAMRAAIVRCAIPGGACLRSGLLCLGLRPIEFGYVEEQVLVMDRSPAGHRSVAVAPPWINTRLSGSRCARLYAARICLRSLCASDNSISSGA